MIAYRRRQRIIAADGHRLGGFTGWDLHHASFGREFGWARELEGGQEPGFYFFRPEDISKPH